MAFYHGQRPHQDTIDLHRLLTDVQPSPLPWRLQVCKRDLTSDMQIRGTATLHLKLRARGPEGDVIEDSGSKRSKDEATKLDFGVIRNANLQSKHKQDTVSYAVVHTNLVSKGSNLKFPSLVSFSYFTISLVYATTYFVNHLV